MSSRRAFDGLRRRGKTRLSIVSWSLLSLPLLAVAQPLRRPVVLPSASKTVISSAPTPLPLTEPSGTLSALSAPVGPEEKNAFAAISAEVGNIFAKCKSAVVRIEAMDAFGSHAGTGFFIDPAGTIYTHYSVAGRSWNITADFGGKKYPAACLLADARSGVVILSIQAGQTPFLPIGDSKELKVASAVVAIGYPMDLPVSPTFGLVAGFDQKLVGHFLPTTHIRANIPVQPGQPGAPLLNAGGEVVGILAYPFDYGAVCLCLPIQAAEKVRTDYLRFSALHPGWVGVNAKPVDAADEDSKVMVDELEENSPAAHSGLKDGDILRRVGRTPIRRLADLRDASFYLTADEMVPIQVLRDGEELTINVQASAPPDGSMALPPARMMVNGNSPLTLPISGDPR